MTNDEQYVPTDGDMRWQYVVKRMLDGATRTHAEQEYTRWLAAHDALVAREALDGLAEWADLRVREAITDKGADDWRRTRFAVVAHRDTHYPEETP